MTLILKDGTIVALAKYHERHVLKHAGFCWNPETKRWWTSDPVAANKLREYADADAVAWIDARITARDAAIAASRASSAMIDVPAPEGRRYLPFQLAGIGYVLDRWAAGQAGVLIADEMGLGKTIQAIGAINAVPEIRRVLVVCPASLKINWRRECEKWLYRNLTVGIANGEIPETDIVIVNYDVLKKFRPALEAVNWDLAVVDECHYIKNYEAQRTQMLLGGKTVPPIKAARWLFLTGTPILNRPIELWNICRFAAPREFPSWYMFVTRYCDGRQTVYGWDVSGASNLGELQEKLRATMMVRRQKAEVLHELSPKRRQVIEIAADGFSGLVRREAETWSRHEAALDEARAAVDLAYAGGSEQDYKEAVQRLRDLSGAAFTEMAALRHELALAKVPAVLEHLLNTSEHKVVIFAHHHDVIAAIVAGLEAEFGHGCAVKLTGEMNLTDRQVSVDRFQTDPQVRFFVGSIKAAGVGITLTAASHVIFAELDWVPANITQAEDRCHRIGQVESVLVQHLVVDGSLDARMAHAIVRKQEWADTALDKETVREEMDIPTIPRSHEMVVEVPSLTESQVAAIHAGLKMLSRSCDGARTLDGVGFSRYDVCVGHSLARYPALTQRQAALGFKLINKYRRQLPEELLVEAGVKIHEEKRDA